MHIIYTLIKEVHEMGFELIPEPDLNRTESNQSINSASKIIHKTMTLNSIGNYLKLSKNYAGKFRYETSFGQPLKTLIKPFFNYDIYYLNSNRNDTK